MDYFSPKFALTTQTSWTIFVIISIYTMGGFSSNFLAFGPVKTNPVKFMGIIIDTWYKVLFIIVFTFINKLINSWTTNILSDWEKNTFYNEAIKKHKVIKMKALIMQHIFNMILWINMIISLELTLTRQLQFILPKIIADLITNWIICSKKLDKKNKS
mgnify:CR=1 FL=1